MGERDKYLPFRRCQGLNIQTEIGYCEIRGGSPACDENAEPYEKPDGLKLDFYKKLTRIN